MSPKAHFAGPNCIAIDAFYKQYLFQSDVSRLEVLKHISTIAMLYVFLSLLQKREIADKHK